MSQGGPRKIIFVCDHKGRKEKNPVSKPVQGNDRSLENLPKNNAMLFGKIGIFR